MRGLKRIWLVVVLGILCSACSVTRYIPDGEYMVQKVTIDTDKHTSRKDRITTDDLETYVRQTPNRRFLGTNLYVWLYGQANPEKHNKWNNWKRRVGEAPVLLDRKLTRQSLKNLKVYMDSRGFFRSEVACKIDTNYRRKRVKMTFSTRQNRPYRIDKISYEFHDQFLEQFILSDTLHRKINHGQIFDISKLDAERERIAHHLNEHGFFNFTVNDIEYLADTLKRDNMVDLKMIVKQHLEGYDEMGQPQKSNHAVYRIGKINIFPNYDPQVARTDSTLWRRLDTISYQGLNIIYEGRPNLRPLVLRKTLPLYPNSLYNQGRVNRAYLDLMSLGYFKTARIAFEEQSSKGQDPTFVSYVGERADTLTHRFAKEENLTCNILCTPTLRQSFKIDLEGSTTSSFYGLKTSVGYQNRNIFRGAESFDVAFTVGYEFMKAPNAKKKRAKEFGVTTGLTFPRFLVPWRMRRFRTINQPKTKIELSVNLQDRSFYHRTLTSAGLTYQWTNSKYSSFSLSPIDVNVVDVSYLDPDFLKDTENLYLINSYKTQFIAGLKFGYTFNNQLKNMGRNATVIRFNAETSGNVVDGLAHLFSHQKGTEDDPYYTIFNIRYSQYFRFDLSLSRKIMLGEKTALAGRLYGGLARAYGNSSAVPFDRLFYAGGSNSMRGWAPRTLGPGSSPYVDKQFPTQLGDMKLEANLELRFPIWGVIHGATFLDAGNIWFLKSRPEEYDNNAVFYLDKFYNQLALNTGLGLRVDIKFAVLRLDWGIQLHNPNNPAGERWIHGFDWGNTALNFGVGYPF